MMTQLNYRDFKRQLSDVSAVVMDIDKTAVDGRVATYVGKKILEQEWRKRHYGKRHYVNYAAGIAGGISTLIKTKTRGEAAGLKQFVDTLASTGCAHYSDVYRFSKDYVEGHTFPGFREFLSYLWTEFETFGYIVTAGMDIAARACHDVYENNIAISDSAIAGNETLWDDKGYLNGIRLEITDPLGKYSAACELLSNRKLSDEAKFLKTPFLAIGDGIDDLFIFHHSEISLASPLAKPGVREAASLSVPSVEEGGYERFLVELKKA